MLTTNESIPQASPANVILPAEGGFKTPGVTIAGSLFYEIWFRIGNRKPISRIFIFKGDLPEAINRAKLHCQRMDFRFCGCYPFIVDLDIIEKRRAENIDIGYEIT